MLSFIYNHIDNDRCVDVKDINTRRREDILFTVQRNEYYKVRQDPLRRAMDAWNSLLVCLQKAETKDKLKTMVVGSIQNPYQKTEGMIYL